MSARDRRDVCVFPIFVPDSWKSNTLEVPKRFFSRGPQPCRLVSALTD
jgi:hypothetical protein